MRLALFSLNISDKHKEVLRKFLNKPFEEIRFLYINTPTNHKPYKSKWGMQSENKWRNTFIQFQEFDLERAVRVQPDFDFKTFLSGYDFIYVSGGNTFLLSYWMKKTGADKIIRDLILEDKVVYGGESAGAIYPSHNIKYVSELDDPLKAPEQINEGLGVADFVVVPHWGTPEHQQHLEEMKNNYEKDGIKTYTLTDNQGVFVDGEEIIYI